MKFNVYYDNDGVDVHSDKKPDQFWREVSDVRKRLRGSPGGGGEGSDQYCMCLKTSISDNCQSRTKSQCNGDLENVWVGRIYTVCDKHGDYDDDHTVVNW